MYKTSKYFFINFQALFSHNIINIHLSPTEGRPTTIPYRGNISNEAAGAVEGKNVNFYAKRSNQVAVLGRFRHDHARKNIPFVWY